MTAADTPEFVAMRVIDVRREIEGRAAVRRHVIVLEDGSGRRRLPIFVGAGEATATALELTRAELPRPMTSVLFQRVVDSLGGTLIGVRITRLAEVTFYAEATLDGARGRVTIDARPSDAINLALAVGAPIYVDGAVIEECERHRQDVVRERDFPDGADQIARDAMTAMRWGASRQQGAE